MTTRKDTVAAVIKGDRSLGQVSQLDFTPQLVQQLVNHYSCTVAELDEIVGNHIKYAYSLGNVEEYMHDLNMLIEGQQAGYACYDAGNEVVYDRFGVGWRRDIEGVFACVHPLAGKETLDGYKFPTIDMSAMTPVHRVMTEHSSQYYIVGLQHIGLFERGWMLRGYEEFMMDLHLRPKFAHEILDGILKYKIQEAELFIKVGVDCVRTGDDWGTQQNLAISPKQWREFILPRQRELWNVYKKAGKPVMHHSCGNVRAIIPDLVEAGVDVLHPMQPQAMPIAELAREFGDYLCFFGGIDTQHLLPHGNPEDIYRAVEEAATVFANARGWIMAPSQAIMSDVPLENIVALIEAAKQYRGLLAK